MPVAGAAGHGPSEAGTVIVSGTDAGAARIVRGMDFVTVIVTSTIAAARPHGTNGADGHRRRNRHAASIVGDMVNADADAAPARPASNSAQRAKLAKARGIAAEIARSAIAAYSPVAKRRARIVRHAIGTADGHRHQRNRHVRDVRGHGKHHRDGELRHRHDRHDHYHRRRHRHVPQLVADRGDTVNAIAGTLMHEVMPCALSVTKRRLHDVVHGESGGAAAERGACQASFEAKANHALASTGPTMKSGHAAGARRPVRRCGPGSHHRDAERSVAAGTNRIGVVTMACRILSPEASI